MQLNYQIKQSIQILVVLLLLLWPVKGFSAYEIELKNGRTLVTSDHWEEGNQLMFRYQGGVAGIPKDLVKEIRETKTGPSQENLMNQERTGKKTVPVEVQRESQAQPESKTGNGEQSGKIDAEDPFIKEVKLFQEKFVNARGMTTQELFKFSEDLAALKKKIIRSGTAHNYNKELIELYSIGDKLEEIFKARDQ